MKTTNETKIEFKNILITGSNKGIGYGIAEEILNSPQLQNYRVILTSRNIELGHKAFKSLSTKYEVFNAKNRLIYYQLDINDPKSVTEFIRWLKDSFYTISILVNNAGILMDEYEFNLNNFDKLFQTNFLDTINFTDKIIGLITDKIIFISSSDTQELTFNNEKLKQRFTKDDLTIDELSLLIEEFRISIKNKTYTKEGWPDYGIGWSHNSYAFSKMCLSLYTKILGKRNDTVKRNIQVYSCCPGWVKTDMGGQNAPRSLKEGMVTPMFLIELQLDKIDLKYQGMFFYDENVSYILK